MPREFPPGSSGAPFLHPHISFRIRHVAPCLTHKCANGCTESSGLWQWNVADEGNVDAVNGENRTNG